MSCSVVKPNNLILSYLKIRSPKPLPRSRVTWATTGATVGGQATLPPPSEMRRGLAPQCNHAWTPILAAAIQKRDVRVGQGGTRPAYWDLFRTLSPPPPPTPASHVPPLPKKDVPPPKRRPKNSEQAEAVTLRLQLVGGCGRLSSTCVTASACSEFYINHDFTRQLSLGRGLYLCRRSRGG